MSTDEDDPPAGLIKAADLGSHIPIAFKLKVAREEYDALSDEAKEQVDSRRERDQMRLYKTIPEITDVEERNDKLASHQQ